VKPQMTLVLLLWFEYEVFPKMAHVLKACSPAGGTGERGLDDEEVTVIRSGVLSQWWTHPNVA
jgi:hypothetical protein